MVEKRQSCPDGGTCHHECLTNCFRVDHAEPLSGMYPGNRWPPEVRFFANAPVDPDSKIICVSYPTIMSGLVLRWYLIQDENDILPAQEIANAGREESRFFVFPSDKFRAEVEEAHRVISEGYRKHQDIDVSRWVTHRTKGLGRRIERV